MKKISKLMILTTLVICALMIVGCAQINKFVASAEPIAQNAANAFDQNFHTGDNSVENTSIDVLENVTEDATEDVTEDIIDSELEADPQPADTEPAYEVPTVTCHFSEAPENLLAGLKLVPLTSDFTNYPVYAYTNTSDETVLVAYTYADNSDFEGFTIVTVEFNSTNQPFIQSSTSILSATELSENISSPIKVSDSSCSMTVIGKYEKDDENKYEMYPVNESGEPEAGAIPVSHMNGRDGEWLVYVISGKRCADGTIYLKICPILEDEAEEEIVQDDDQNVEEAEPQATPAPTKKPDNTKKPSSTQKPAVTPKPTETPNPGGHWAEIVVVDKEEVGHYMWRCKLCGYETDSESDLHAHWDAMYMDSKHAGQMLYYCKYYVMDEPMQWHYEKVWVPDP